MSRRIIMAENVLQLWPQIGYIAGGATFLLAFAILLTHSHRTSIQPGSKGHRDEKDHKGHEVIRPDGYIDSFSNEIEEAGGSLPPLVRVALPVILLWWLFYIIIYWTQK
jgi:hypothetical protein